jgi:hypothetical protein
MPVTKPPKCGPTGLEKKPLLGPKETIDEAGDASDGDHVRIVLIGFRFQRRYCRKHRIFVALSASTTKIGQFELFNENRHGRPSKRAKVELPQVTWFVVISYFFAGPMGSLESPGAFSRVNLDVVKTLPLEIGSLDVRSWSR